MGTLPDSFYAVTITLCLTAVIVAYFCSNPLRHGSWFVTRRFINWLPLGMTYAFLCMGRYNIIVAKGALGTLMTKEDLGIIFGVGTWTYALSFLINGPLIDKKIGGKNGIMIAALGASLANVALGVLTWLITVKHLKVNLVAAFSLVYAVNMYFQSYGAMSIIKVKAYWFHVRERGVFGAIFGTFISSGVYFAFDWGGSIVSLTKVNASDNFLKRIFLPAGSTVDATWAVFFVPAAILIFWLLMDLLLIKDTPEECHFPHFDTADASSGQMHVEFSVLDLLKKIFANPLMLMIACVELTSGIFRYCALTWYPSFAHDIKQPGAEFFAQHWGWFTCVFGIIGGFAGGIVSDRIFHSRRGPPAALLCGLVLILAITMSVFLFFFAANRRLVGGDDCHGVNRHYVADVRDGGDRFRRAQGYGDLFRRRGWFCLHRQQPSILQPWLYYHARWMAMVANLYHSICHHWRQHRPVDLA